MGKHEHATILGLAVYANLGLVRAFICSGPPCMPTCSGQLWYGGDRPGSATKAVLLHGACLLGAVQPRWWRGFGRVVWLGVGDVDALLGQGFVATVSGLATGRLPHAPRRGFGEICLLGVDWASTGRGAAGRLLCGLVAWFGQDMYWKSGGCARRVSACFPEKRRPYISNQWIKKWPFHWNLLLFHAPREAFCAATVPGSCPWQLLRYSLGPFRSRHI